MAVFPAHVADPGLREGLPVSGDTRSLPERPSLRFLKLEARRRLDAGEFSTLHDAQLAVAREYGMSSWAKLKQAVEAQALPASYALAQIRWVVSRFSGADGAGWEPPGPEELGAHFAERFQPRQLPELLAKALGRRAAELREPVVVLHQAPLEARARVGPTQFEALAEDDPAHRLTMLRVYPAGHQVSDTRAAAPPARESGDVPAGAVEAADQGLSELHLPGLIVARVSGQEAWALARGWADLDRGEPMRPDHRFPACSVTKLITATTVLRLVADGRVSLDDPANKHLGTIRLADSEVTIRNLLTHTSGVDNPDVILADAVPDLAAVTGSVLACSAERGAFRYSNGGYGALGQMISDVTGWPYPQAAARLVLEPLGMGSSSFPTAWPGTDAVTTYRLQEDGIFAAVPGQVCTLPAAGGLWTTAADLLRFGASWRSLLPEALAREALTPYVARTPGATHIGLGWHLSPGADTAGHPGGIPGASAFLATAVRGGRAIVAFANRSVPMEPVAARVVRAIPRPDPE
jgi:CubicO group peptidase (beta-lactamase class C family)